MGEFLTKLKWRCVWSWAGIKDAWTNEHSFRSWVWANLVSTVFALWLLRGVELALILSLGILILASELMNTAVERVVDRTGTEQHPLSKAAKDAGSAAVAVTAIAAGIAWAAILFS